MGSVGVGSHDDLALLAVNISPPGETLDVELSPQPESLTSMRQAVGRWLRAAEAGEDEIYEMLVASGEAWSNAVADAIPPPLMSRSGSRRSPRRGDRDHRQRHGPVATTGP